MGWTTLSHFMELFLLHHPCGYWFIFLHTQKLNTLISFWFLSINYVFHESLNHEYVNQNAFEKKILYFHGNLGDGKDSRKYK